MKKNLSLLFLSIFVLPVFAFFGCSDVATYGVTVYSSSEALGTVSGYGTFDEGTSVTLTATPKTNGNFVAWVYQSATLLENNQTYKIETTETKSTITFTINSSTQGSYTAVFESKSQTQDSKMMYVKLEAYRFASAASLQQEPNGISTDSDALQSAITANLTISHGKNSNSLIQFLSLENTMMKDNLIYKAENINQVLNLDAYSARHIRSELNGRIDGSLTTTTKDLRANIEFKESSEIQNQGYTTNITYSSNGTYEIKFKFEHESETYYLILTYKNLSSTPAA